MGRGTARRLRWDGIALLVGLLALALAAIPANVQATPEETATAVALATACSTANTLVVTAIVVPGVTQTRPPASIFDPTATRPTTSAPEIPPPIVGGITPVPAVTRSPGSSVMSPETGGTTATGSERMVPPECLVTRTATAVTTPVPSPDVRVPPPSPPMPSPPVPIPTVPLLPLSTPNACVTPVPVGAPGMGASPVPASPDMCSPTPTPLTAPAFPMPTPLPPMVPMTGVARVGAVNVGMIVALSIAVAGLVFGLLLRWWARRTQLRRIH